MCVSWMSAFVRTNWVPVRGVLAVGRGVELGVHLILIVSVDLVIMGKAAVKAGSH